MSIKLLIADDHPLMAQGIANTFNTTEAIVVKKIVHDGEAVIHALESAIFDVVLLDIEMPKRNGIECAKIIVKKFPEVKIAMLSMHQESSVIKHLMEIGVQGYMLKTIPSDELIFAIKTIHAGKEYFNASITKALLNPDTKTSSINLVEKSPVLNELTTREIEIIKLISKGLTNVQIGEKIFISPRTVDTHRTNMMKKIGVNNVAGLVRFAFQNGLA